jgi:hypothetical protein
MRGCVNAAVAVAVLAFSAASLAENEATIRPFDLDTVQVLGQHMYRQDQEAWKATDILLAKHSPEELTAAKARGWIVSETAERDVVRFLREGASGLEVAYDVIFARDAKPILSEPENRALTPEEIAQADARHLAAKSFTFRCSNAPANTVAFRDPKDGGWLVWVMSATNDPNQMVLGGHIRFSISADGKSIIQKDALSKGCNILSRKGSDGTVPVAYFFTHIVSDTPVETHVFASLTYGVNFFVGTPDRSVWSIEKGAIKKVP